MIAVCFDDGNRTSDGDRQFEHVRAVLFDKDGTLANTGNFLARLGRQRARLLDAKVPGVQEPLLMALGISTDGVDPTGLMAVGSRWETEIGAAAYVAETGLGWREALALVQDSFAEADRTWGRKAEHTPPFEDSLPCLQRLQRAGLRLGIASADTPENLQDFVERYELGAYFSLVLGSDRQVSKPSSAFLTQACEALEVAPSELLLVGDSAADLDLARQQPTAGCVIIDRGGGSGGMPAADAVVTTLETLQPTPVPLSLPPRTG